MESPCTANGRMMALPLGDLSLSLTDISPQASNSLPGYTSQRNLHIKPEGDRFEAVHPVLCVVVWS